MQTSGSSPTRRNLMDCTCGVEQRGENSRVQGAAEMFLAALSESKFVRNKSETRQAYSVGCVVPIHDSNPTHGNART